MKTFDIGWIEDALALLEFYQAKLLIKIVNGKKDIRLIPPKGFKFDIVKRKGKTTVVKLSAKA